ncbi:MAG: SusC/RagA family TonB-linked outer membrane protein, partial [Bacteroidia bacterium]|nr:SusC/RagA family TonB-linked outer membrane protein [Bacteroidia bacterium]
MSRLSNLVLVLLLLSPAFLLAQSFVARGTITSSEDGTPVVGAAVQIKATVQGVFSDEAGQFRIEVPGPGTTLQVRYFGFTSQDIVVNDADMISITLAPSVSTLDEVVVVGYGTQKRSQITGAVSSISADEIMENKVLRVEQALQGRAAGVQVTQNSGSPGSALTVRIRGIGTINNSDPLYLVDGVIVNGLDFLNPNDIESISVLKDAASTAIYGTQGANGVVLITTKNGSFSKKAEVSYAGYVGQQSPWKLLNLLNAEEYAIMQNEARIAAGIAIRPEFADPSSLGEGTDWQNAVFTTAPISSHQVSVNGGSDRSTYAISGNYFQQDGIVGGEKAGFDRLTLRFNNQNKLNDRLSLGTRLNFVSLSRNQLPENNEFSTPMIRAINLDPTSPISDDDGNFLPSRYLDTDIFNPVNQIDKTNSVFSSDRIVASIVGEVKILENLTYQTTYSADFTYAQVDDFIPSYFLSINDQRLVNTVVKQHIEWRNWQWDNLLTYIPDLGDNHEMNILLGTSARNEYTQYTGAGRDMLRFNDIQYAYLDNGDPNREGQFSYGGVSEASLLSYFGRANYDFRGKYQLAAIMRVDGSSNFGINNRYGYFPSFSGGWVISEESFMESVPVLNFLKLRASWGRNGNQRIPAFQYV